MATVKATVRRDNVDPYAALGKGNAGALVYHGSRTIELAAAASGTIIDFGLSVPSNVRVAGISRIHWDDLATSGSPTLDLGFYAVDSNVTSDDDGLNDGLALSAVSTANVGGRVVKDFANDGKRAYEFVSGQTTDPGGILALKGVVRDAATTATGTVTLELFTYND